MNRLLINKDSILKITELTKLTLTAIFIILGILIPYITGHLFMIPGTIFLPMHIPVFLCGIITGPKYGFLCGILTPALSSLMTGMPVSFPMLPIMAVELSVYGLASGFLTNKIRLNIFLTLVISMVLGRLGYALIFTVLTNLMETELAALSAFSAFLTGLPGIAIQLVIIPSIYLILKKGVLSKYMHINKTFKEAIDLIESNQASLVLVKNKKIVFLDKGKGISPLLKLYENNKEFLRGSYVFDKVIGKGAAIIIVLGKAKGIYGLLGSQKAIDFLNDKNIKSTFRERTDYIINNNKNGMCPIEEAVLDENDLEIGYNKIKKRLKELSENNV
ncbi:DUF1893 domain-containing protein [Acholeplasma sp. OttesenSCG-928-E16]|nr:DUF1893 domain-containing protein [Acholeplasma sp. OttesenSCG-928-E16]